MTPKARQALQWFAAYDHIGGYMDPWMPSFRMRRRLRKALLLKGDEVDGYQLTDAGRKALEHYDE